MVCVVFIHMPVPSYLYASRLFHSIEKWAKSPPPPPPPPPPAKGVIEIVVIQQCLLYETGDRVIILACPYSIKIHMTGINECTGILIDSSVHRQNGYAGMSVLGINRESSFTGMPKRSMKS